MSRVTFDRDPRKWDSVSKTAQEILQRRVEESRTEPTPRERAKPHLANIKATLERMEKKPAAKKPKVPKAPKVEKPKAPKVSKKQADAHHKAFKVWNKEQGKARKEQVGKAHEVFGKNAMGFFGAGHGAKKPDTNPHSKSKRETPSYKAAVKKEKEAAKPKKETTWRQWAEKKNKVADKENPARARGRAELAKAQEHLHNISSPKHHADYEHPHPRHHYSSDRLHKIGRNTAAELRRHGVGTPEKIKKPNLSGDWEARSKAAVHRSPYAKHPFHKVMGAIRSGISKVKERLSRGTNGTPKVNHSHIVTPERTASRTKADFYGKPGEGQKRLRATAIHEFVDTSKLKKGSFTRQANAAGESVSQFAHEKEHAKGKTGKRARLALAFAKMRKKKKKHHK